MLPYLLPDFESEPDSSAILEPDHFCESPFHGSEEPLDCHAMPKLPAFRLILRG